MDSIYKEASDNLLHQNGLIVLGRGVGINRLIMTSLAPYIASSSAQPQVSNKLTFIVNASANFHSILCQCLYPLGYTPSQIPKVELSTILHIHIITTVLQSVDNYQ
jgi:hypothetical protein